MDCAGKYAKDIVLGNVPMPQAVVCIYDRIAVTLVTELFRNGVRVPEDIIVVGIDGELQGFNDVFSITSSTTSSRLATACSCGHQTKTR